MAKIGRNDSCPCGSGKKYKNCCFDKEKEINPVGSYTLPSGVVVDTYPGDLILEDLCFQSKEFRNLYTSEMDNLKGNIVWLKANPAIASTLSYWIGQKGKFGRLITKGTTDNLLILDTIPPKREDILVVAHELMHYIVFNEGFPGVSAIYSKEISSKTKQVNGLIAGKLNSMIHDIIVDSRLKNYGFDYTYLLKRKYLGHIRSFQNMSEEPGDSINYLLALFEHVLALLQGNVILDGENVYFIKYKQKFSETFPNIAKEGQVLASLIQSTGYDTPDKVGFIFQNIINSKGLNDRFRLHGNEMK